MDNFKSYLEESADAALKKKADKSGYSLSILKQVYKRGVAAWKNGHKPGTTPQQWGMARVNSFMTGGRTRVKGDPDLWAKQKGSIGKPKKVAEDVNEKTLTPAEKKKREEIAKAMERDNPGMDMGKKMAIATATAKKVAEEQSLDEKVYASDYNVGHEKSQFGGHRPKVTHKKTGRTMYLGATSYKKPEHAKGHASAYLNGYQAMGDKHADRKAREYATQNQKHQHVKESLDITEISTVTLQRYKSKASKIIDNSKDEKEVKKRGAGYAKASKKLTARIMPEEKDPNEYDREGEMMKSQLRQISSANEKLMKMVGDDDNLPEWVQNKVTKATDYIRSVRDYLESENGKDDMSEAKVDEISLDMLAKKVSNTNMGNVRKAMKTDKVKADLAMMKKKLDNHKGMKPIKAQTEAKVDEISTPTLMKYRDKARQNLNKSKNSAMASAVRGDKDSYHRDTATMKKREKGLKNADRAAVRNIRKEDVQSADKKPEKYVKPDGKVGIRMVRVDKQVIRKDA